MVFVTVALVACGDGGSEGATPGASSGGSESATSENGESGGASKIARLPIDPASTGGVAGTVAWKGTPPERTFQKMVGDPWCLGQHADGGFLYDAIVTGAEGGLANAFVQVVEGLEGWEIPEPGEPVRLDQIGCLFLPKMVGVQLKQTVQVGNSDGTMHNVHTKPERQKEKNFAIAAGAKDRELSFKRSEIVEVVCDVHAWMRSWIGVAEHPFFAVSDADGNWAIEGLPAGDYVLEAWHEKGGTSRFGVTVTAGSVSAAATVKLGG